MTQTHHWNIEKLIISTDGSEFSEGAVREGIGLAKKCSAKLFVVTVIEANTEYAALAPQLVEKAEREVKQHLQSVSERASAAGVSCETVVRHGEEPFRSIVEEAEKNGANMIITGRRGRKGISRLMMGSETARIIGHSPCNVLVVPRSAKLDLSVIVVASDGSKYSEAAVEEAISTARGCNAELIVLSVVPSETGSPFDIVHSEMQKELISNAESKAAESIVKTVKDKAEKEGLRVRGFIVSGKPYEAITEMAKEHRANLIIVGSHGRTGLSKLLMGSVTERVIGLAECAVLVVKA